jgi:hypothetical protein
MKRALFAHPSVNDELGNPEVELPTMASKSTHFPASLGIYTFACAGAQVFVV